MDDLEKDLVPGNEKGGQSNTESETELESIEAADKFYNIVKGRLLQPGKWHHFAGKATADFQLVNEKGEVVQGEVKKGFYFRIDIPGPGSGTGDGYDWVQVEKIEEVDTGEEKVLTIQVRPATNPLNDKTDVAHFFSEEATSSFMVTRKNRVVKAAVYGRNEKPNIHAESFIDKARNAAVATGAITAFSKFQWKSLVDGLLKP